jgi:mono/diheme cytochrome c family protein
MKSRRLFAVLALATLQGVVAGASSADSSAEQNYQQLCVNCHGAEGKGDGPAGLIALPMPRDFSVGQYKFDADSDGRTGTDEDLFLVIRDGAGVYGGNPLMAAWGHLGDDGVRQLVAYVRGLERSK